MKRNAVEKKLLLSIAGWAVTLVSAGCGAASNPENLDEFFSQGWMLESNAIEGEIKKMLTQHCGGNPTEQCMKEVGFQECLKTKESIECTYSEGISVKHDSRAKVKEREEMLSVDVKLKLNRGMSIRNAEISVSRSGTNFIFR